MPPAAETSVLRQKTQRNSSNLSGQNVGFGRCLVRAADQALGLKVILHSEVRDEIDLNGLLERAQNAMLLVLDGPEGQTGAMMIDSRFVSQVTEFMTIGQLGAGAPRVLTRTDAALLQPFVDAALSRFKNLSGQRGGFRFGAFLPDAHGLGNLLEGRQYSLHRVSVALEADAEPVEISFAFPLQTDRTDGNGQGPSQQNLSDQLHDRLMQTRVTARVSLCNLPLSFEDVRLLQVGQMLEVPGTSLGQARLICGGQTIASGTLGQFNGLRALKVTRHPGQSVYPVPVKVEVKEAKSTSSAELVETV